jgi:hypothetical protein
MSINTDDIKEAAEIIFINKSPRDGSVKHAAPEIEPLPAAVLFN